MFAKLIVVIISLIRKSIMLFTLNLHSNAYVNLNKL